MFSVKATHSSSVSVKTAKWVAERGPQSVLIPPMSEAISVSFPVSERNMLHVYVIYVSFRNTFYVTKSCFFSTKKKYYHQKRSLETCNMYLIETVKDKGSVFLKVTQRKHLSFFLNVSPDTFLDIFIICLLEPHQKQDSHFLNIPLRNMFCASWENMY